MGASVEYLLRHPKTGRLSYRRAFPPHLRPFIPGQPRELKRSLGAMSIGAPGAMERFRKAAEEYERTIRLAQKAAARSFDPLDLPTIAYLAEAFLSESLAQDEEARWDEGERNLHAALSAQLPEGSRRLFEGWESHRWAAKQRESVQAMEAVYRSLQANGDIDGIVELWGWEVEEFAKSKGLLLDVEAPEFRRLCVAVNQSAIEAADAKLARLDGEIVPTPPPSRAPQAGAIPNGNVRHSAPHRSISDLIDCYRQDHEDKWSQSTKAAYKPVFRLLRDVLGEDREVASLTREDGRLLFETVKVLPRNLGKSKPLQGLTVPQAVEKARQLNLPTLSPKSINDSYLSLLSSLFRWAVNEQWLAANPVAGLSVADPVDPADKRDAFSLDQLKVIFGASPWLPRDDSPDDQPLRFWGPLLALFHGMRRGEIAALGTDDVIRLDGFDVIWIRKGKTKNARRSLPVHPELIRMGFLAFAERQKKAGHKQLFPEEEANSRGQWGDGFSDWFSRLVKKHKLDGTRLGMHSFRHSYQDALRAAGLHGTAIAQVLTGRAGGNTVDPTSDTYGTRGFPVSQLADAVAKVKYPGLDLSHLYLAGKDQPAEAVRSARVAAA